MTKITSLSALTGAGVDIAADVLPIVDISAGASGNKKITVDELIVAFGIPERARDALGTALVAGTNITITPNDGADTITIDASSGGAVAVLDEGVSLTASVTSFDFVGAGVTATNVGGAVTVNISGGGYNAENARDDIGAALVGGNGITVTVNDGADTITVDADGWQLVGSGQTATGVYDFAVDGAKANVDFTGIAGVSELLLVLKDVTLSVSGQRQAFLSVASTFYSGASDYASITNAGVANTTGSINLHATANSSARSAQCRIDGINLSGLTKPIHRATVGDTMQFLGSTGAIDGVRVNGTGGGNINGGKIWLLGR